jgi:hypothetical protein
LPSLQVVASIEPRLASSVAGEPTRNIPQHRTDVNSNDRKLFERGYLKRSQTPSTAFQLPEGAGGDAGDDAVAGCIGISRLALWNDMGAAAVVGAGTSTGIGGSTPAITSGWTPSAERGGVETAGVKAGCCEGADIEAAVETIGVGAGGATGGMDATGFLSVKITTPEETAEALRQWTFNRLSEAGTMVCRTGGRGAGIAVTGRA